MINHLVSKVIVVAVLLFSQSAWSDDVATLIQQGNEAWSAHKMEQAEKAFRKAIEFDSESAQAHTSLAGLLQTMGRTTEAIEEYQTAITLDPENARLFIALALSYLHQQSYEMAQAMANEALRLDPKLANAQKLVDYIEAKEDVIRRASKTDVSTQPPVAGELPAGHPTSAGGPTTK